MRNLKSIILFGIILQLCSCSQVATKREPSETVKKNNLKTLNYRRPDLSSHFKEMIKRPGNIAQLQELYLQSKEDKYARYSLMVIMYEKSVDGIAESERAAAREFLKMGLKDEFEWVRSKAVWAMARVGTMDDFQNLIDVLKTPDLWIEDDVHASLAMIRQRSANEEAGRAPASNEEELSYHDTSYWSKWWSKKAKK